MDRGNEDFYRQQKRARFDRDEPPRPGRSSANNSGQSNTAGISSIVAQHYNSLNNNDISQRQKSQIYFMRNFNNWIKSIIIRDTITYLRSAQEESSQNKFVVLDLGCGKGGDLIKFQKSSISHLVCADIAEVSIEHCMDRYKSMNNKTYTAEFINVDCSKEPILPRLSRPDLQYDMTSCQFSFHYCFESYEQVCMMVRNASESLKIGGIFCGTLPDSTEVMKRLKLSGSNSYGNDVYSITFGKTYDEMIAEGVPLFGAKYNFHLTEVVDCPEFLVYFPVLEEICRRFGLELILKKRFDEFFMENKTDKGNFELMNYMDALEKYPPRDGERLLATGREDYKHIRDYFAEITGQSIKSLGTLSKSEWEAVTLYLVFSFRKTSNGPI